MLRAIFIYLSLPDEMNIIVGTVILTCDVIICFTLCIRTHNIVFI